MTNCTACLKELGKKDVLFTEDNKPYCINPFTCNSEHPNSVDNIVARGGAVKMFTEEELELNFFDRLGITQEMKERIIKVTAKPQSIRLQRFEISHYLLSLQATKGLNSISEAVRYCVEVAMEHEPVVAVDGMELPPEESSDNEPINVPVVPKSVNVNWDDLPPLETVPTKIQDDEEDEF